MGTAIDTFLNSIDNDTPPTVSIYLQALWYDAKGNWATAHELIQDLTDTNAAWVHAYLHRKEGDNRNANYWYNKAKRKMPDISLEEEWKLIAHSMMQK